MRQLKIPSAVNENNTISLINDNIKDILSEVLNFQLNTINKDNENKLKELLNTSDLLIVECHNTQTFKISRNNNFSKLVYEYQRLKLKYETYTINKQIEIVTEKYNDIENKQLEIKNETNNLVYNILGFIASFSIVSAAVSAIIQIKSITDILLFMAFSVLLLLTTLIGLHNFYKNSNNKKKGLQNNYFLWKMMVVVIILLICYKGAMCIKENQEEILKNIGRGIGEVIDSKLTDKLDKP